MRFHSPSGLIPFVFLAFGACSREEAKPGPGGAASAAPPAAVETAAPKEAPPEQEQPRAGGPSQGTADLVLTGAIAKELKGPIVICGTTRLGGREQGGTWAIRSSELDLQIMATSDAEFDEPSVVLNAKAPARVSYVWKRKSGTVTAQADRTVASIDADLHNVVGKETVHVKGTMTCPAK